MAASAPRVAVLNLGSGNFFSVLAALRRSGVEPYVLQDAADLHAARAIVIPGQGHFGRLTQALDDRQLRGALRERLQEGLPYLGICAGLQLLFAGSDESPASRGLALLRGRVERLRGPKLPHMGWNRCLAEPQSVLSGEWLYFANTFAPCADAEGCVALADYGGAFAAACVKDNLTGVQFHPEKSGRRGADFLERWTRSACAASAC